MLIAEHTRICTFAGHHDAPESMYPRLLNTIETLVTNGEADTFYVGDRGAFDAMAARALSEIARVHSEIDWCVILARMPRPGERNIVPTLFPDELTHVPPRFAIARRNLWMLSRADILISYSPHIGNAAKITARARCMGIRVIALED